MHDHVNLYGFNRHSCLLNFLPNVPVDKARLTSGVVTKDHDVELLLGRKNRLKLWQTVVRQLEKIFRDPFKPYFSYAIFAHVVNIEGNLILWIRIVLFN
jgi:hypothetical protein